MRLLLLLQYCYSSTLQPLPNYKSSDSSTRFPKRIWTFYDRPNVAGVELFLAKNLERIGNNWTLTFLTLDNITAYLDPLTFPKKFYELWPQIQSDYIRICLVQQYGGFWMDATTLIGNARYLDFIRNLVLTTNSDMYAECQGQNECPLGWLETGFFYAPKGSALMKAWKSEMDQMLEVGIKQYAYSADKSGIALPRLAWKNYPNISEYFIVFVTQQVALQRRISRDTKFIVVRAADSMYKLQNDAGRNTTRVRELILREFNSSNYNISKLNNGYRQVIWPDHKHKHPPIKADLIYPWTIPSSSGRTYIQDIRLWKVYRKSLRIYLTFFVVTLYLLELFQESRKQA